jgi:hypothetical protein
MRSCPYLVFALWLIVAVGSESGVVNRPVMGCYGRGGEPAGTRQAVAQAVGDDVHLFMTVSKPVHETRERDVTFVENGQEVVRKELYMVMKMVPIIEFQRVALNEVRAFGTDRKPIAADSLAERLKKARPLLFCTDDEKVDTVYLQLVKPDTLVLVVPRPQPQHGYSLVPGVVRPDTAPAPAAPAPADPAPAPPLPITKAPAPAEKAPPGAVPVAPRVRDPTPPLAIESPNFPSGSAPLAGLASVTADGKLRLRRTVSSSTEVTGYQSIGEGDAATIVPVKIVRSSRTETTEEYDAKTVQVFTTEGNEIPSGELASRLAKETAVLASADGRKVDTHYFEIIKQGTLVLIVPAADFVPPAPAPASGQPPAPAPAPRQAPAAPAPAPARALGREGHLTTWRFSLS